MKLISTLILVLLLFLSAGIHASVERTRQKLSDATTAAPVILNGSSDVPDDSVLEYRSERFLVEIYPSTAYKVRIGSTKLVELNVTLLDAFNISMRVFSSDSTIVALEGISMFMITQNGSRTFQYGLQGEGAPSPGVSALRTSSETETLSYSVTLKGKYVGYTSIQFEIWDGNSTVILPVDLRTSAIRVEDAVYYAFRTLIYVGSVLIYMASGCEIKLDLLKETLKKPKAPAVGLITQFTIMPLLAYAVTRLMGYTGGTALGMFAMGCAPGGGASNMYTHLLDGELTVSIAMTTLSVIVSMGMIPLWLYTLGTTLPKDPDQETAPNVPFVNLIIVLAVLFIPIAIGVLIKWKLPKLAKIFQRLLKPVMFVFVIAIIIFAVYANFYIFESFNAKLMLSGALLPYGGFIIGGLVAWAARFDVKMIKTIAIETGIQNVGVVVLLTASALDQPDADLSLVPPVAAAVMTPLPLLLWVIIHNCCFHRDRLRKRMKRCCRKNEGSDSQESSHFENVAGNEEDEIEALVGKDDSKQGREMVSLSSGHLK